jgi:hypothetical protein
MRVLRDAVRRFEALHGRTPSKSEGLEILKSAGELDRSSFLSDPWGTPYVYTPGVEDFEIITVGPDGIRGTSDDFSWPSTKHCPPWPVPLSESWMAMAVLASGLGVVVGLAWWGVRRGLQGHRSRKWHFPS